MSSSLSAEPSAWRAPVPPAGLDASVELPGSKSLTNRALLLGALADGPGVLRRPLRARDTGLMVAALRALGAEIDDSAGDWTVIPNPLVGPASIDCGLAGTVLRFLPPVAGLATGAIRFDGAARARLRPMAPLLRALQTLGVAVSTSAEMALPLTVVGRGRVPGGEVALDASDSSQLVSGLLLAGARYDLGVDVAHVGPPVPSAPHIAMSVEMLRGRGVDVDDSEPNRWRVRPGPIAAQDTAIEPDLSSAAPFAAAALVRGGRVQVTNWPVRTTQAGDRLREILPLFGAEVRYGADGCTVTGTGDINGVELDLHEVGELTPVLTALCALANAPSRLSGIAHLRGHESDRLRSLTEEINRLGGAVAQTVDGLVIEPRPLHGGVFHTSADHRLAHAAAVLGLGVEGIAIDDIDCVDKTFPGFAGVWTAFLS